MNHPKPWKAPSQSNNPLMGYIQDADGGFIATQLDPATALEIVAAVNSHSDLLAACEAGLQELQTLAHSFGLENFDSNPAVKQLRSAIAKATGGSQ